MLEVQSVTAWLPNLDATSTSVCYQSPPSSTWRSSLSKGRLLKCRLETLSEVCFYLSSFSHGQRPSNAHSETYTWIPPKPQLSQLWVLRSKWETLWGMRQALIAPISNHCVWGIKQRQQLDAFRHAERFNFLYTDGKRTFKQFNHHFVTSWPIQAQRKSGACLHSCGKERFYKTFRSSVTPWFICL